LIDEALLKILANPCHPDRPPLKLVGSYLVCTLTGQGFPIIDGIPRLLPEDMIEPSEMEKLLSDVNESA